MELEIQHQQTETKGAFLIQGLNGLLAEMTYSKAGTKMIIIDRTEISDELRGQGAGKKLVEAAVEYARSNQIKILPLCPFAASVFQKNEDLRDVLN